jgi:eukaryotic-like serine/threonine-protein kinase
MDPVPGAIVGEKYRLEQPLASGGMGAVWVARHTKLEVDVAIKFLKVVFADRSAAEARFEREAKAAAQLKSPHIVRIYDYGVENDSPYMAMELLVGEDMSALIAREGRVSMERAADLAGQIARALAVAHEAGIVHRDLKPSNVFLAREGGDEIVKILDFGIAKSTRDAGGHETTSGTVLGSPIYMSPEQGRGGPIDHRSDLWSFGVLLFELVTGRKAFTGANAFDIYMKICSDKVPLASEIARDLPSAIDAFFERALSRDPVGRFASAREMAQAFMLLARTSSPSTGKLAPPATRASDPPNVGELSITGREDVTAAIEVSASSGVRSPSAAAPPGVITGTTSVGRRRFVVPIAVAIAGGVALSWIALGGETKTRDEAKAPSTQPPATSADARVAPASTAATAAASTALPVTAALETATTTTTAAPTATTTAAPTAAPTTARRGRGSQPWRKPAGSAPSAPSASPPSAAAVDPVFGLPVKK